MLETKQKGLTTELQCITYFYQLGYQVSIPYGENSRYDFIVDINNILLRIQVKTSSDTHLEDEGTIEFHCRSTRKNSGGNLCRKYTKEEIDYFATFYNNKCYLIPVEECSSIKKLRFRAPKNGQIKGITFATNYEVEKQILKLLKHC